MRNREFHVVTDSQSLCFGKFDNRRQPFLWLHKIIVYNYMNQDSMSEVQYVFVDNPNQDSMSRYIPENHLNRQYLLSMKTGTLHILLDSIWEQHTQTHSVERETSPVWSMHGSKWLRHHLFDKTKTIYFGVNHSIQIFIILIVEERGGLYCRT